MTQRAPASTRRLARRLGDRYRTLLAGSLDAVEAERRAFNELLADSDAIQADHSRLYEEFLAACAPYLRRLRGVYYTPQAVVDAQVRLIEDVLRYHLGCEDGFGDDRVWIVDPAAGSGAYPLAILDRVGDASVRRRMLLFEPMPGAAAIARARGLDIHEYDALATSPKLQAPIVVCLGNPPYRRATSADWRSKLDGFVSPADGVHLKNLYNDYVYFWHWTLRVACESRSGPAIVCLVTAASYLRGPAFVGLRRTLRRVLDELWLIDLEGDHLAARASDNVFPIRTPVAIALGVRHGRVAATTPAIVRYARLNGTRSQKLEALDGLRNLTDLDWRPAASDWGGSLVAQCRTDYARWPALTELFPWQVSGAQLKRTWPIGTTPEVLRVRWRRLLELPSAERRRAFGPTRDRDLDSTPADLMDPARRLAPLGELPADEPCREPVRYAYRSFDRHWVLPDARLGDFMRPSLWRVAGPSQVFMTSLLTNVLGHGPAAVASAFVPDLDHFRGSFGARAVIPLWCDASATRPNVAGDLLVRLSDRYGLGVSPQALMSYCYALLTTRSYVRRFEEELRTPGPRVPLTPDARLFHRCATLGEELLALQTYRSVRVGEARCIRVVSDRLPEEFAYNAAQQLLRVGDGLFAPISPEVWQYAVSGYHVVAGWLRQRTRTRGKSCLDRSGSPCWTPALSDELLELVWLLEATLELEPALDALLDETASSGGTPPMTMS